MGALAGTKEHTKEEEEERAAREPRQIDMLRERKLAEAGPQQLFISQSLAAAVEVRRGAKKMQAGFGIFFGIVHVWRN